MTRWAPDAAGRLHQAALDLFVEQGFSDTTVPQIAERAGLTTRSFFRYYADKREVLFAGEDELPAIVERIFAEADTTMSPLEVIGWGLRRVVVPRLEEFRAAVVLRRRVVRSDDGLRERELRKLAILQDVATSAFSQRGLEPLEAEIAGRLAVAVYDAVLECWLADDATASLTDILTDVVEALARTARPPHDRDRSPHSEGSRST